MTDSSPAVASGERPPRSIELAGSVPVGAAADEEACVRVRMLSIVDRVDGVASVEESTAEDSIAEVSTAEVWTTEVSIIDASPDVDSNAADVVTEAILDSSAAEVVLTSWGISTAVDEDWTGKVSMAVELLVSSVFPADVTTDSEALDI